MNKLLVSTLILLAGLFLSSASYVLAQLHPCKGDFNCDGDVDGGDAAQFKQDFGNSIFNPICWPDCQAPVPKTGQTTSYATGDDGDLEKGVAWSNPRFTDHGDGTVSDNLTGLMWTKDSSSGYLEDVPWSIALDYINGMNEGIHENFGHADWRLPNLRELQSLIDYNIGDPALPPGHPFINVRQSRYWSSTTWASSPDYAWYVFSTGGVSAGNKTASAYTYVWPVRGGH